MGKLFGTDGIRGIVGDDLTTELAMKIGESSAYVLGKREEELVVLIGRDTRISGQMLTSAISAGLMSEGAKVIDLGVVPTPLVSYLVKRYNASMGVMISASHNPSEYNGIKLFNNEGFKLPDRIEFEIEKYLFGKAIPTSSKIGTYHICDTAVEDYTEYLKNTAKDIDNNLKIIVDCAYGSASTTAPILFKKLGLNVEFINYEYDGYNINKDAGSTHLEGLVEHVISTNADIGIAYDGDADRCLIVDENGDVVDGDEIMAICAYDLKQQGSLTNNTLVGTVMSNLGLSKFCEQNDINFEATKVGDRYVLEKMLEEGYILGGEQSGHVIFKEHSNTGDGELTSIQILNILSREKKKLSELKTVMKKYPQVLLNIPVTEEGKIKLETDSEIAKVIRQVEKSLARDGRVLVRASGTENIIRVMIEGLEQEDINVKAKKIGSKIKKKFGR